MTRPLSNDLRERVVSAVLSGESCRAVALRFGVAVSSVVKWSQRYRATGSVTPGKMGGHRKPLLDPHRAFILERIKQTPHLTLYGLRDELPARGVRVSHNAVWLFLRREGLRFKKNTDRRRRADGAGRIKSRANALVQRVSRLPEHGARLGAARAVVVVFIPMLARLWPIRCRIQPAPAKSAGRAVPARPVALFHLPNADAQRTETNADTKVRPPTIIGAPGISDVQAGPPTIIGTKA
jgi:transposase